ncbi:MAG: GNAT family N-acetyltransferase [Verrucomicrobiales bacterium]|nr:GNAT family N-acetyltransferase [Verrucomicrobiales bacterium]
MSAAPITYLQMLSSAELRPKRIADARFSIRECTVKQWPFNRFLYFTVGEDWEWTEKRSWSDVQWQDYAESDRLWTFAAYYDDSLAGYFELYEDDQRDIEIAYFGLMPGFYGRGFGGALLTAALEEAWKLQPGRVWVHTCTLDHASAIPNYQARGMTIYKVETPECPMPNP